MHYDRDHFPSKGICQHIAMGLDVLARHMELQPHLFRVQLDHAAVLPQVTVEALRDDFVRATVSETPIRPHQDFVFEGQQQALHSCFFYEEERHTLHTALCALEEYRDNLGEQMVLDEMRERLNLAGGAMLSNAEGLKLAQIVSLMPPSPTASPHQGEDYHHRLLSEGPGAKEIGYPDGYRRYRIVEEVDGVDIVLDSFDSLFHAEKALNRSLDHDQDAYLMDADLMSGHSGVNHGHRSRVDEGMGGPSC